MLLEQPFILRSKSVAKPEAPWTPGQAAVRVNLKSNLVREEGVKHH